MRNGLKIFAIEFCNVCDARCSFCPYPSPEHTREKGFMSPETLSRICEVAGWPRAINISGLGEPLLHKDCIRYISHLCANGFFVQLNTNGRRLDQGMYDALWEAGLHQLVVTADYFKWKHGELKVKNGLPVKFFTITREPDFPEFGQVRKPLDDWAERVGKVDRPKVNCSFLQDDWVQIAWDGTIQRCCEDYNCNEPFGNVHTWNQERWQGRDISLCKQCKGFVFKSGIVAGDYEGSGQEAPNAFVQLDTSKPAGM